VKHGTGTPTEEGLYVAEVYWGWRTLAWNKGEWNYHHDQHSPWIAGAPVQWFGPLPEPIGGATPPPIVGQDPKMEYDL